MNDIVVLKCINALNEFFISNRMRMSCWYKAKQYISFERNDIIAITYFPSSEPLLLVSLSDIDNDDCVVFNYEFISAQLIHEVRQVIKGVIKNE